MYRSTVTSKGQITIPKEVRDQLNLQTGDTLIFKLLENTRPKFVIEKDDPAGVAFQELRDDEVTLMNFLMFGEDIFRARNYPIPSLRDATNETLLKINSAIYEYLQRLMDGYQLHLQTVFDPSQIIPIDEAKMFPYQVASKKLNDLLNERGTGKEPDTLPRIIQYKEGYQ